MTLPPDPDDPFAHDPDGEDASPPMLPDDREGVLGDLEDLEVFEALLSGRGVRGLAVPCPDCAEPHYVTWDLLRANLRSLLDSGRTGVHEPAFAPDPAAYVTWDYARGFADASLEG